MGDNTFPWAFDSTPRPKDWHPLAESDPVPGDPEAIGDEIRHLYADARRLRDQARSLRAIAEDRELEGQYADKLRREAATLDGTFGRIAARYEDVAERLTWWRMELTDIQEESKDILHRAKKADSEKGPDDKGNNWTVGSMFPELYHNELGDLVSRYKKRAAWYAEQIHTEAQDTLTDDLPENAELPADVIPRGNDPQANAHWWASLAPAARKALIAKHPSLIRKLDGIPAAVRKQATRLYGIKLAEKHKRETRWPYEWGKDGKHPRSGDSAEMNWAERDLLKHHPVDAAQYLEISKWARETAEREATKDPDLDKNAFRHAIWQAKLTYVMGEGNAKLWADAHEAYHVRDQHRDHMADLVNNEYGRSLGVNTKKEIPYQPRVEPGAPGTGPARDAYIIENARRYAKSDDYAHQRDFEDVPVK